MILFSCPNCDTEIEVPDSKAGGRGSCGECGHRLQIPASAKKTTRTVTRRPEPKPAAAAKATPKRPRPQREDDEDQPQQSSSRLALWVGGGVAAAGVVGVALFLLLRPTEDPLQVNKNPVTPPSRTLPAPNPALANKETAKADDTKQGEPVKALAATGQDIYQHVLKSTAWVVNVSRQGVMTGTGTLIDRQNRLVLTNYHVVHGNLKLVVFFPLYKDNQLVAERDIYLQKLKNKEIDALNGRVLKEDARRDLALIQLDRVPDGVLPLAVARASVRQGESVHSVGNTGKSGALWLYTPGTVRQVYHKKWQARGGDTVFNLEADVVETQSATNPGDSGGPLVNGNGELVGVTQGGDMGAQLLSVFIDVREATTFIEQSCKVSSLAWERSTRALVVRRGSGQVPDLIKELQHTDPKVRVKAAQTLAEVGPGARLAVAALIQALKDSDDLVRRLALEALTSIGAPDKADQALVAACLKHDNAQVRLYAAEALGKVGTEARSAGPALVEALKDKDATVRQGAARALGQIGTDNRPTVFPALSAALKDPDPKVRLAAAEALTLVSPLEASDVPLLSELLKHPDLPARAVAARALAKLGAAARAAIPALIEALKGNEDREVRRATLLALAPFGPEARDAVPALVAAMKDEALRPEIVLLLEKMGPAAKDAVKVLAEALSDTNPTTRDRCLAALAKIGSEAKDAVPELTKLLEGKERGPRLLVLATLGAVGKGAEAAVPTLLRVVGEHIQRLRGEVVVTVFDKEMHDKAVDVLAKIGKAAVKPLRQALRDSNRLIRLGAVAALGKIGPDARTAASDLRALTLPQVESTKEVREAAASAWREVQARKKR